VASQFVKVMPIDYRRVLLQEKARLQPQHEPEVGHG
jgi:hypothetical protein